MAAAEYLRARRHASRVASLLCGVLRDGPIAPRAVCAPAQSTKECMAGEKDELGH